MCFQNVNVELTGKRSLGRRRCKWEDNIRMDLKEIVFKTRNWVDSAHGKLESSYEFGIESPCSISHGVSELFS